MDDMEDDARYPQKPYSFNRQKLPSYPHRASGRYVDDQFGKYNEQNDPDEYDIDDEDDDDDEDEDNDASPNVYSHNFEGSHDFRRYPKRQRLKNSAENYQFVARNTKSSFGERNSGSNWSEDEEFVLLEAWGDKFLQLGRRSLRSEDWVEVAEKVSEETGTQRTEAQCRSILDSLKRKYKKEKSKMEQMGTNGSKWRFFKKFDILLGFSGRKEWNGGLACGVDSGEFVFMDTRVYLERANGFDEMRDSPADSEDEMENEDEDGLSSKRCEDSSLRVLADSVQKFGEIYEKIESSKREHMLELEKMREDFHRELELQKKQILEKAHAEIAKIRDANDNDEDTDDDSAQNLSE
ncbi:trihelix transcription factor ASIL2 isoform X1 [Tripterygium wilfordii]|uniref:Trihelix transcription factor ASIL2 isoform X1 n=1 Tax=Tripterygium wilfordii TaxID=458696 RepID=A0A7J7D9C5_TRIWF|nr:trihelix transcription factor ASIL1-like [Tripterygium wilfordii]XP_038711368.1 trihelix transcription factor ASIL1-like [Tripterygium wilfordii]KAF5742957.1 trihelix transcription factor ASIL2 isoform X1 [Tripterygium wilfordii]